jgi:hypothetical protein
MEKGLTNNRTIIHHDKPADILKEALSVMPEDDAVIKSIERRLAELEKRIEDLENEVFTEEEGEEDD